jgi:hypothetical protein
MSRSPKILSRVPTVMDASDLARSIALCAAELEALSHSRLTLSNYIDPARHLAAWLRRYPGGTENASIFATVRGSFPTDGPPRAD